MESITIADFHSGKCNRYTMIATAFGVIVTATVVLLVVLLAAIHTHLKDRKYPPGPHGVPFLGYLPFMIGEFHHECLTNLSKKYGNVVSVRLGSRTVVVLNDWKAVREALVVQGRTFSGRPEKTRLEDGTSRNSVALSDGAAWKEHKRYVIRTLKDLGVGRSSIEDDVIREVEILAEHLKTRDGQAVDMPEALFLSTLNIICKLACGKRYESGDDDEEVQLLNTALGNLRKKEPILSRVPLLKQVLPRKFTADPFLEGIRQVLDYVVKQVHSHWSELNENHPRDYTDIYLADINRSKRNNGGAEIDPFTRQHLISTLVDLLNAGVETSEATLLWSLLYVTHHPEVQTKVQRELDGLIDNDSVLAPNSKARAPYTQATLMEVQRCASVVPLALPHRTTRDTVLLGHNIPKDTIVFPNLYAVHHDESYWGDPNVFRPERFLDADGQVTISDHLVPFSMGPRVCLGEPLAKTTLFIFFTCLLRRFTFAFVEGQPKTTLEAGSVGVTVRPKPFSLLIKCRK